MLPPHTTTPTILVHVRRLLMLAIPWLASVLPVEARTIVAGAPPVADAGDSPAPVEVRVGVFLNCVPEVDLHASCFCFDTYVWLHWNPEHWPPYESGMSVAPQSPAETLEIVGLVGELRKEVISERDGYCCLHLQGRRVNFWDVRDYPFDRQELQLLIEDSKYDATRIRFIPDLENSGSSPELRVPGAIPGRATLVEQRFDYPTNFGDLTTATGASSPYSRLAFTVPVERDGAGVFVKLFTALFVSTICATLSLFIDARQVDPRFGLAVGALFCIVASGYAVNSVLPDASGLSYADKLHLAALVCVLVIIAESAYSLAIRLKHGESGDARARRLDRLTFAVVAGGYATTVVVLTYRLGP